jgi:hypothetical protein
MERMNSMPIGLPWDRIKPLGSNETNDRANRRLIRQFNMSPKWGCFAGLRKRQSTISMVYWVGKRHKRQCSSESHSIHFPPPKAMGNFREKI